jgi:plastocyanin domain-containing protein
MKFREDRIKQYKLIYPSLATTTTNKSNKNKLPAITTESTTSIYTGYCGKKIIIIIIIIIIYFLL